MSRRRRRGAKDPPDSVAWQSYRPSESKYWFYGGPWIPPEKIEPGSARRAEDIRPHESKLTRLKSVTKLLDETRKALEEAITLYRDVHERGVDALPWEWEQEKIRKGECDPLLPTPIHYRLCNCYRTIADAKAVIPVCESIIDGLDSYSAPLFHWQD